MKIEMPMKLRLELVLAALGLIAGLIGAYVFGLHAKAQPPVFTPASNPYNKGVYAEGMVEGYQESGENITIYPNISGTIIQIPVREGQSVHKGDVLVHFDDSVQKATVRAALAAINFSNAQLRNVKDELTKNERSYRLDSKSISQFALDDSKNAVRVAKKNLKVNKKNYLAAKALLEWYTLRAPTDGMVLAVNAAVGSYVSSTQGIYDTYTQGFDPVVVMKPSEKYTGLRCYIDEILVPRLKIGPDMKARMFIRGTNISVPLEFVRIQPFISPKIELSNERQERVDVRVLPVIFRFRKTRDLPVYPGMLVDVYVAEQ